MMFKSQTIPASLCLALLLATGKTAQAKTSLETRTPDQSEEQDRDENGAIDEYWEEFTLEDGLTVKTYDRREEGSGKLRGRTTFIKLHDKIIWTESYLPSLRERGVVVERLCPFGISTTFHGKSRGCTVTVVDDKANIIAVLVRKKGGRLAPVTDEELKRLNKLGEAVSEFAEGILEDSDDTNASKAKAYEHLHKLDKAVSEYDQSRGERAAEPPEPTEKSE